MKKRHIFLIVLLGALAVIGFVFGIISLVMAVMKGDAYEMSLSNLYSSNQVTALIGNPIEPGYFVMGSISTNGGSGRADLNYSVTGSIDSAKVYVIASKELGVWQIEHQVVQISGSNKRVYLVGESPPNKSNQTRAN